VVIVNWLLPPLAPGVTGLVPNAQVVCAGKLEQARVAALENVPPTDVTLIVYSAFPPCATVCAPVGEATAKSTPTPDRVTACVLPTTLLLLSVKVSVALRVPVAVGVMVTLTVQVPLGTTVAPVQVSAVLTKSLAFVPPSVTAVIVRLTVPVLVTVSVWAALVVLMG
jgi:hypothetical protein